MYVCHFSFFIRAKNKSLKTENNETFINKNSSRNKNIQGGLQSVTYKRKSAG